MDDNWALLSGSGSLLTFEEDVIEVSLQIWLSFDTFFLERVWSLSFSGRAAALSA